jgi:phosphopantothenoylcysteine decarboxylase/phosphopantothenate--cysteine ligase
MNRQMWSNAATQRNVAQLRADGVEILGPGSGDRPAAKSAMVACSSRRNLAALLASAQPKLLAGKRAADGGPDGRSDRSGTRDHQPQLGQDGILAGQACVEAGRTSRWYPDRRRWARRPA